MIDRQKLYSNLKELGPAEVRRKLEAGEFGAVKVPVIEEWLQTHESSRLQERHDQTIERMNTANTIANRANLYAKSRYWVSAHCAACRASFALAF